MNKRTVVLSIVVVLLIVGAFLLGRSVGQKESNTSADTNETEMAITEEVLGGNELIEAVFTGIRGEVPTVEHTRIVNENTDSNNLIGKSGEYQYAGIFYDTRTDYRPTNDDLEPINIQNDTYGTVAGGSMEIFSTNEDAKRRGEFLEDFQTGLVNAGPYRVVDNIVLRVSENYTASQQEQMLDLLENTLENVLQ